MSPHAEVIVAGLGAHGSATAYRLARRGKQVIGFDRFRPPHTLGSSHGKGRVIRHAYSEGPEYVPLVLRSAELWRELERDSGDSLMRVTGGLNVGPANSDGLAGIQRSAEAYGLAVEVLSAADIRRRWPAFRPHSEMIGVYEPGAGAVFPEKCVSAHLRLAAKAGADLRYDEPVISWRATAAGGVEVSTPQGAYTADSLVLTVGVWLPRMLNGLRLPLRVERQVLHWFAPARSAPAFSPETCPNNAWEAGPDRLFYCQPDYGDGCKVAFHHGGVDIDPDAPAGSPARTVSAAEVEEMRAALFEFVPDAAGRHLGAAVCMYTNTPDEHFLVDLHPEHPQVVIGSPCSGHGFKFAAAMGEVLADLATTRRTRHDISAFGVGRLIAARA